MDDNKRLRLIISCAAGAMALLLVVFFAGATKNSLSDKCELYGHLDVRQIQHMFSIKREQALNWKYICDRKGNAS